MSEDDEQWTDDEWERNQGLELEDEEGSDLPADAGDFDEGEDEEL